MIYILLQVCLSKRSEIPPTIKDLLDFLTLFRLRNKGGGFYWRGASIRENTVLPCIIFPSHLKATKQLFAMFWMKLFVKFAL